MYQLLLTALAMLVATAAFAQNNVSITHNGGANNSASLTQSNDGNRVSISQTGGRINKSVIIHSVRSADLLLIVPFPVYSLMCLRLLILLFSVTAGSVRAQPVATSSPEVFWQVTAGTATAPASPANEILLLQVGTGHQATIAMLGQQNQISLTQTANANAATVQLTGQGNQLQLTQAGDGNRLAVGLNGTNNQLRVSQSGGDVVSLLGLSDNNARIDLIQRNGNNTIIADGLTVPTTSTGMGVANLKIEQSGGATIRIQNGRQ